MKRLLAVTLAAAASTVPMAPLVQAQQEAPIYLSLDVQRNGEPLLASKLSLQPGRTTPVMDGFKDFRFQVTAVPKGDSVDVQYTFFVSDGFGAQSVVKPRVLARHDQATTIEMEGPLNVRYRVTALTSLRENAGAR